MTIRSSTNRLSTHLVAVSLAAAMSLAASGCGGPASQAPAPPAAQAHGSDAARVVQDLPLPVFTGDHNLIRNGAFDDGLVRPWLMTLGPKAKAKRLTREGALCVDVSAPGVESFDVQLRHRDLGLAAGHVYRVGFTAHATRMARARPRIGSAGPPYEEYWASLVELTPVAKRFTGHFTAKKDDPTAELTFHLGGRLLEGAGPLQICFDDVELSDPTYTPLPEPASRPRIHVNQLGYRPDGPKWAALADPASDAQTWSLVDEAGRVVADGTTTVFGDDPSSGDHVHTIDFSSFQTPGRGLRLRVGAQESDPFDLRNDLYGQLKRDALWFFYHNRSGIPIALPHAGETRWTRGPGHPGDRSVPCGPKETCRYKVDASGGWYDAGDHGKYVITGAVTLWALLGLYERTTVLGRTPTGFEDGSQRMPEAGNGVPDLLDEARFELDFLRRLQVPEGQPLAGMVHHKVHDVKWTSLGESPATSKMPRFVHPPSTTATLDFAAVLAMAARVWRPLDATYASLCLAAARRAYDAATRHPKRLAAPAGDEGGGPYDDADPSDEWYWAAAELYATTGESKFKKALEESPHFQRFPGPTATGGGRTSSMDWQNVQALGTLSLAISASVRDAALKDRAKRQIVTAADRYREATLREGYRVPFSAEGGRYPWGSNSFVVNNMLVLAVAHDLTGEAAFREAVELGMDYLLGRNPLGVSYVTGYGDNPVRNPHHRFWAHQAVASAPEPPPGVLSGGPNSGLEDPMGVKAGLRGCPPQRCFVDHIEAWSLNEIAINWNGPLVWVAWFLDESRSEDALPRGPTSAPGESTGMKP